MNDDKDNHTALLIVTSHATYDHDGIHECVHMDNLSALRLAIATALAAARAQGAEAERERCAAIPDEWVNSGGGCAGHDDNPCCHIRTAYTIAERIRALATAAGGEVGADTGGDDNGGL